MLNENARQVYTTVEHTQPTASSTAWLHVDPGRAGFCLTQFNLVESPEANLFFEGLADLSE